MGSHKYYQFINTVDVVEFAPAAYHFHGVFDGVMINGAYVEELGVLALSDYLEDLDEITKDDIGKIIKDKIEELKEEELKEEEKI
jgi:hypothetical protein